jgi:protein gp37
VTSIEWTDKTWNPVTGCTKVSPGCDHCYAENIARRFAGGPAFPNGFDTTLHPQRLNAPKTWRRPAMVFVNSMSDLFHADVPDSFIAQVFAVMAQTPQHTYQILTKRHGRMRSLIGDAFDGGQKLIEAAPDEATAEALYDTYWPLPNVWLGVSVEDQQRAELRIPALLETAAEVRFISAEPLLGPLDLERWFKHVQVPACQRCTPDKPFRVIDAYSGHLWGRCDCDCHPAPRPVRPDWVIVGGESGPGARPMNPDWARDIVNLGQFAGFDVFIKQMGSAWAKKFGGPSKGQDPNYWPEQLQVRQMPNTSAMTALLSAGRGRDDAQAVSAR